jgi:dipeptidyl aminopeptidase/acylaminoacyl peptidase
MRSIVSAAFDRQRVRRARGALSRPFGSATASERGSGRAHAALAAVLVVAVAATVAACGGSPAPAATVTVTATPSASSSAASPSPSASADAASAQLVVAVASGTKANGISLISGTGKVKQLVAPSGGPVSDLSWAPDGQRLAFLRAVSDSDSASSLFVYNVPRKLLYQVGAGVSPATIQSFAWLGATRLVECYFPLDATTYRTNGTLSVRDIAKSSGQVVKDGAGHVVKGSGVSASADGLHLAYVAYGAKSGGMIAEKLHVYDASNLAVSTVASGSAPAQDDGDQFTYPAISPDGTLIAVEQTGSDIGFGLTVYGTDGAKHLQTGSLLWPAPVSWSPQGSRLAFGGGSTAGTGTDSDALNVWAPGASKATRVLTVAKLPVTSLAWTPKASQIAYAVAKSSGLQDTLWIVNADGSNRHLLLANGGSPAWAVTRIAFP